MGKDGLTFFALVFTTAAGLPRGQVTNERPEPGLGYLWWFHTSGRVDS